MSALSNAILKQDTICVMHREIFLMDHIYKPNLAKMGCRYTLSLSLGGFLR